MSTVENANASETMSLVSITLFKVELDNVAPQNKDSLLAKMYLRNTKRGLEVPVDNYQSGDFTFTSATMVLDSGVAQSSEICIKIIQTGKLGKLTSKTIGKIVFRVKSSSTPIMNLRQNELKLKGKTVGRAAVQIEFNDRSSNVGSQSNQNIASNNERPTLLTAITSSTLTSDGFPSPPPSEVSSGSSARTARSRPSGHLIVGQLNPRYSPEELQRMFEQKLNDRSTEGRRPMPARHGSMPPSADPEPHRIETQGSVQSAHSEDFPLSPVCCPPAYGHISQPDAQDTHQPLWSQNSAPASVARGQNDARYFPTINNIVRQGQSDVHLYHNHGYSGMSG